MTVSKVARNTFIFTLWTFLYFWWFRSYMLSNWDFDVLYASHWQYIWEEWWYGGWVIKGSYYWLFLISLFLCIPLWILSLCFLLSRNYSKYFEKAFWDAIYERKIKAIQAHDSKIRIKKKKSYKEIRPNPLSGTPHEVAPVQQQMYNKPIMSSEIEKKNVLPKEDDFMPFDLPKEEETPSFDTSEITPVPEDFVAIMKKAGAAVITNPKIDDLSINYLAVSKNALYYVLLDAEKGNWLADEERFNDEDPLWYSEEPIRVSPVSTLKKFQKLAEEKLAAKNIHAKGHVILVKTDGNIINVEDMQDTWKEMDVLVARSDVGMPEELPTFEEVFPTNLTPSAKTTLEKIEKIFEK